jgi:SAM-dependent methyltransferase
MRRERKQRPSNLVHDTAYEHGRLFFALYGSDTFRTVVELGSQDVNGSLRDHCPSGAHYIGLDLMPAKGVDLVVGPDAPLPLVSAFADAVVTSSAFEHNACFWDTFLELIRILRAGGLLYLNAPSNGAFHRYPLDCWRFYPDAGVALVRWAARRGVQVELLESLIGLPQAEQWADFVAVFRKAGGAPAARKGRIADYVRAINIHDVGQPEGAPLGAETQRMPDATTASNLEAELDAVNQRNAAQSADLAVERQTNEVLSADLAAAQRHSEALSADLIVTRAEVAALHQDLSTAEQRVGDLIGKLAAVTRDLLAVHNSTSWRLTASLRRMVILLRGR